MLCLWLNSDKKCYRSLLSLFILFVMIRLSIEDGIGSIELLNEDETNHLVGEGHWGKGDFLVGSGIDFGRKAIRSSNNEDESLGNGVLLLLNPVGKVDTAKGLTMLVQQDKVVGGLELAQDKLSFTSLLLFGCEGLGVFQFGDGDDVKSHIVLETSGIVVDESLYVGVGGAAYEEKVELHGVFYGRMGRMGLMGKMGDMGDMGKNQRVTFLTPFTPWSFLMRSLSLLRSSI